MQRTWSPPSTFMDGPREPAETPPRREIRRERAAVSELRSSEPRVPASDSAVRGLRGVRRGDRPIQAAVLRLAGLRLRIGGRARCDHRTLLRVVGAARFPRLLVPT